MLPLTVCSFLNDAAIQAFANVGVTTLDQIAVRALSPDALRVLQAEVGFSNEQMSVLANYAVGVVNFLAVETATPAVDVTPVVVADASIAIDAAVPVGDVAPPPPIDDVTVDLSDPGVDEPSF